MRFAHYSLIPVLALLAALAAESTVYGRGAGTNCFLISADGKFIRKLQSGRSNFIDYQAERIFQTDGKKLKAMRFDSDKPLWEAPWPVEGFDNWTMFADVPGVLAIVTPKAIHGYDKATGKELYTTPVRGYQLRSIYGRSWVPHGVSSAEGGQYLYLVDDETEATALPGGRSTRRAVRPTVLARFDLVTGKQLWHRKIPARSNEDMVVEGVAPGVAFGKPAPFYFDPGTGESLTRKPFEPGKTKQLLFQGDAVYHMDTGKPPKLTVYEPATYRELWSIKQVEGLEEVLPIDVPGWVVGLAEKQLLVIDTNQKRVTARIVEPNPYGVQGLLTNKLLVLSDENKAWCVDPASGKTHWTMQGKRFSNPTRGPGDLILLGELVQPRKNDGQAHEEVFAIKARSLKDGKVQWEWKVPPVGHWYDSAHVGIVPCKSGFVVVRSWIILD